MKFMVVLICVILVLYGFYGLTVRESIVFTFLGFSISAIFAAFAGMWIIAMAATVSLLGGSMMNARIIACQLFAIAMWMLIIDVAGVTESTQLLGVSIYNIGNACLFAMTVLTAIYVICLVRAE
ncbi:Uncharacterised protein (plasmid) [Klebsiella aerogenes]|uniref:Uncharacterized protein n=3 Tax=Enterobacterales TaxID=91347 RepID=A0A7G3NPR0_ECOLX|nr:hypothetical protein L392_05004 [Klebsiella pneumoniae MGH 46]QGW59435.1 hypothetical protein KLCIGPCB_00068 [Klebsiella pneumoniae]QGW59795.1 hypothetical protein HPPIBGPI_00015 [Escherichia coli]VED58611.1 Uncharacterised protein [Klebsiella aerogenes]SSG09673.1 Uncharacterised protein [Klebsiella pneumoniae]